MLTTDDYWDCECEVDYIHSKAKGTYCPICGAHESEMPDSRIQEVKYNYDPLSDRALLPKKING